MPPATDEGIADWQATGNSNFVSSAFAGKIGGGTAESFFGCVGVRK